MRIHLWAATVALALASAPAAPQSSPPAAEAAKSAMRAGNYAEAYCVWKDLAQRGDAEAQYNLGWMYHNGYGLAISDSQAQHWWELAAAQHYPDALVALGNLYRNGGRDVAKDPARAVDYFLGAAQNGDEDAALLLRTLIAKNDASVRERVATLLTKNARELGGAVSVKVDKATLCKSPGGPVLAVMLRGAALIELSRRSGWLQAGDPADGKIGWIKATLVEAPSAP